MALASVRLCVVDDPVDCGPLGDEGRHRRLRHDDEWCRLEGALDGGPEFCGYSDCRHDLDLNGVANTHCGDLYCVCTLVHHRVVEDPCKGDAPSSIDIEGVTNQASCSEYQLSTPSGSKTARPDEGIFIPTRLVTNGGRIIIAVRRAYVPGCEGPSIAVLCVASQVV
eukprot:scaffold37128_cov65-Phaeocystis_antarctica.AAC.4